MINITINSSSGQFLLSAPVNTGAKGYYSLMQHDYITLPFSLQSPVEFGIGSYADLRESFSDALGGKLAKIYKVCDHQTPTYNTATGGYDYTLRLDAYYWLWKNKIFKYTPEAAGQEASWSLTASLDVHLGVFLRNLDALGETYGEKGYEFSIDSTVENKAVAITYDNTNLIDALSRMAEAWDCEWWVTENVIHFGRLENGDAVELETGVNAESMTRNESKGTYATRIYAFGSTRNIPENYRPNNNEDLTVNGVVQKRLMLPADTPYIDARPGLTEQEVVESVVVFDDIYPRRVGTLSDVKTVDRAIEDEDGNQTGTFKAYQYKDTGLTFEEYYTLEGQELRIVFQSGKLNGLDFGVIFNPNDADPAEQLWEIVANEDYGRRLPDEVMKPENGDTYILYGFDIKLVSDQYIPTAEQELKAKAEEYVAKTQVDDGTYTVPLYSSWVKEDEVNHTFDAGQRIKLKNPAYFGTSGRTSRVIGWEMCLDIPYDRPVYTIGESAQYSRLGELEDKVDALTLNGQAYQGIGGGSGVYLIRTNDSTPASNSNAYSALRARQEFISKTKDDTAKGKITFVKGIDVGTYSQYAGGGTFRVLEDLTTYAEVDKLRVRVKAYFETLEIINTNSVGGKMILTAGGGVYLREVKDRETLEDGTEQVWDFYRCYFLTEQDGREVENRFHVGDLAMSQSFNIKAGTHQGVTNHYYWREVVGIGDDYIDLSKTICDTGSDAPMAEDTVCHLGNRSDKDRQGAIIFSAVDVFSPSITLYYGINDFSLVNKDYVSYGVDKSTGNAFFRVYGEMYAGDREQTSYVKYTPGVGVEMRGKFLNQAGESYDTIIDSIQNAIDGNIETWFGEEEPTLSNEPAVNWTTDEDKNTHLGDLYYSDAGVAYRFQMEGAQYVWKMLKDSDITKALADAKAAKDAADAAQEAADAAADRLTAWASDGVISPTEKQGIKDEIARIDADKANITAQYTKYGLGTPTAFNNAYTAYRAVLVSLSASTPENIAIPSDFSSKQAYYYNERTSALGAIADASITSVNNVTEQLEQMKQDFAEVKEDVAGVKTSVDGLKNFTDEAFADGIVDRNESAAIASHINSIETFAKDAAESYTKVYENTLLTGTAKTNLANAYTAFTTAKTELVTTINGAIADGLVDALEKSAVDGKYTAFNTKYGDFVANLNAANRAIQDAINQNALQALQKIGELDYLKAALKEFTTIEGGLIQSSTLALGYTSDSGYQVMAGTNGIYDASKLGGGIASWWGGAMFDRFEYTEETMPENVASALVRMDGTGYFAKGNLWWESDGTLHADPLSFFVGEDSVGDVLGLFQFVKSDAGVEYVIPQHPFQKLEIGNYLQIGKAQLYWDEANQAFYVRHQDGVSPVGFYATGFISTKGANPDAGGAVSGASKLTELEDVSVSSVANGQVLSWDATSQRWVNKTVEAGLDTAELEEYLTSHDYAKKSDIPALTDYATQEWVNTKLGSYATTSAMNSALGNKVDKVAGKELSSNDFTDALLTKLNGIEEGANKYVLPTATGSVLGGVKVGTTLAIASGVLNMKAVGTAGTYTKVTVDAYGRVTGHASLVATDIPNLPWSKITSGKPTTLSGYGITDAYTKTEADGRYVNVSGDIMTGNLTLKPLGGPWLNGKTQAPIMTNGASSTTGSTYHPIIWGKTDAGDVWNLGHGASDQVGFFGFYSERTANGTDWFTYIKVSTGVFYQSKDMNVTGLITATAGLTTPQYIQIGSGRIKWDSTNNALYVEKSDGTAIGFYSKGFISAKGANDDAGGSVSGVTALSQLSDVRLGTLANGQALVWDSTLQKWANKTIERGLDETALAQYLTNNGYATQGWATSQFAYKTGTNASGTWPISVTGQAGRLSSTYTGGGGNQPPSYFNNMGLKVNMMSVPVQYSDVIVVNGYGGRGADVPYINAIAFQKTANAHGEVYHARAGYGASSWGTWYKFLDEYNYTSILDSRYLRTVSLATISDLHSSWDAVLKAQKPAWLTTVSLATISDLHASWDALLKAAPSAYVTRWPAWSEVTSKPTWIGANKPSYAFSEITGKPTTLSGYGITDGVNAVSVTGSGNAVTTANVSGHTLTLTKGSTFLLSSAYTAADVLAKIKTVDGSGSGLDADTLDGYHLSNIETGGWTSFTPYVYDAANGTRYYCYRIGNLNVDGDVILRVRATTDINYPSYNEWTLRWGKIGSYAKEVVLIPNTPLSHSLTVYVDTSNYVWIKCNVEWDSTFEYKIERNRVTGSLITSGVQRVETQPSNVSYSIANFGSKRNGADYTSYTHYASKYNAKTSVKIGNGTISWDATNNCFHFSHGLYSDSFVSAKGANNGSGGTVSGVTKLSELSDVQLGTLATNQVLSWNGSKWVNKTLDMGLDETALAQYLTNNQYVTMPTGDGRYALKAGTNATGTWPISITGNAATTTKLALQDTRSVNTAPFANGQGLIYYFKYNTADGLNDGGTYHSVLQFDQWSDSSGGLCKQLALTDGGNMWFRTASSATAWGAWKKLLDSSNYSSIIGNSFVKKAGDTMTGVLTMQHTTFGSSINIKRNDTSNTPVISYSSSSAVLGRIGVGGAGSSYPNEPVFYSGTTSTIEKIWTSGNDGSGSGLDADLLDGTHKTGLLTSVTSSSTTNLSVTVGGTTKSVADLHATYLDGVTLAGLRGVGYAMQMTTIDASSLNVNTWYPVTINIGANHQVLIAVIVSLDSGTKPSWSTHQSGFSVRKVWYTNGSGWGANPINRMVLFSDYSFTSTDPVRGLNQLENSSNEYVYVRGGGKYYFYISHGKVPVLRTSSYTVYEQTVAPTATAPAAISRTNALITDNVYSATKLQTARTINGTAFNGTSNIVTSYWGTARTLSLTGNATGSVSMNGSSNVSMSVNVNYATSAGNASTLGGTSKAGLFTALSSSNATNLSVTIGGTTKSITDLYANYAVSAGNADTLDNLHSSSFFRYIGNNVYSNWNDMTAIGTMRVTEQSITNGPSGAYNYGQLVTFNAGGTLTQLYFPHSTVGAYIRTGWSGVSQYYSWQQLATINSNVYSATKLQTARTIWGRPFDGTAPVSGDMTGVGSISASGNITVTKSSASVTDVTVKNSLRSATLRAATSGNVGVCEPNVDQWIVGTNGTNSFTMIGNFGIGTTSPSYKLHVAGTGYFSGALTTASSITAPSFYASSRFYVSAYGTNYLGAGNGDNATTSTYNVKLHLHWGMAVTDNGDKVTMLFNGRSGTIFTTGGLYSNGYVSALGQNSSDARLKTNIRDFKATTLIKQLHPKSFKWNDLAKSKFEVFRNTGTQYGLIAQDVKEVMPEWVDDNLIGSGYMGIRYDKLIPVLLQGEIETISRVETLEDKVRRLEKENYKLKKKVKELERRTA